MSDTEIARGYRDRAEELRLIAEAFDNAGARQDLLSLADVWETMAERLDPAMPLGLSPRPPFSPQRRPRS